MNDKTFGNICDGNGVVVKNFQKCLFLRFPYQIFDLNNQNRMSDMFVDNGSIYIQKELYIIQREKIKENSHLSPLSSSSW